VARNRAVLDLGRALSDGDGIDDLAAPLTPNATLLGMPDDSPRSQMHLSSPVLAGSRVRLSGSIQNARSLPGGGLRVVFRLVFEVEVAAKPACTVSVVYLYYP
jgi:hypothetical protein